MSHSANCYDAKCDGCGLDELARLRAEVDQLRKERAGFMEQVTQRTQERNALAAERDQARARVAELEGYVTTSRAQLLASEVERERLRKALEFYAQAGPMDMAQDCDFRSEGGYTIASGGKRARERLAASPKSDVVWRIESEAKIEAYEKFFLYLDAIGSRNDSEEFLHKWLSECIESHRRKLLGVRG